MKKALVGMMMLLGLGWAQAGKKMAMVLKVEGPVSNQSKPVMTGQLLESGDALQLADASRVTVLLLNKGERQEVSGAGSMQVTPDGLKLQGCNAKVLSSTQLKLALNGENHRQIGGMVVRDAASNVTNSVLDQIEIQPGGVKVSRPAEGGTPPRMQFYYLDRFYYPVLNSDLQTMKLPPLGVPPESILLVQVSGQKQGDRWVWDVPWPMQDAPQAYALEVFDPADKSPRLYTRLYHASPKEQSELATARQQVAEWARQEPGSIGPAVYLANLLDDKGQLEEALKALQPALALQPKDQGLIEMQARLLVDLGRYADAAEVLKAAKN